MFYGDDSDDAELKDDRPVPAFTSLPRGGSASASIPSILLTPQRTAPLRSCPATEPVACSSDAGSRGRQGTDSLAVGLAIDAEGPRAVGEEADEGCARGWLGSLDSIRQDLRVRPSLYGGCSRRTSALAGSLMRFCIKGHGHPGLLRVTAHGQCSREGLRCHYAPAVSRGKKELLRVARC